MNEETVERLAQLRLLDTATAVENCGSADAFLESLRVWRETLDENAARIEQHASDDDLQSYTVLVHALKSSSRLVGALALSADALLLEQAGREGDRALVGEKTPALLAAYRALGRALDDFFEKPDASLLPLITPEALRDALARLKSHADDFDLDALDAEMAALSAFRFPEAAQARIEQIRQAVTAADWGRLTDLLES